MCICVCICVFVSVYVCLPLCVCVCVCVCLDVWVCVCACMCFVSPCTCGCFLWSYTYVLNGCMLVCIHQKLECVYKRSPIWPFVCAFVYVCVSWYACVYVHMCECVLVCLCICVLLHVCVNARACVFMSVWDMGLRRAAVAQLRAPLVRLVCGPSLWVSVGLLSAASGSCSRKGSPFVRRQIRGFLPQHSSHSLTVKPSSPVSLSLSLSPSLSHSLCLIAK